MNDVLEIQEVKQVKLFPKSKRAKSRVFEHGEIMNLVRQTDTSFLFESLNETCRGEKWLGWFTDNEVDFEEVDV